MSLCPEAEFRDSLSDGEFWDYVLLGIRPGDPQPADGDDDWDPLEPVPLGVCPVCGSTTACGYDEQGRALIHASDDEDEVQS